MSRGRWNGPDDESPLTEEQRQLLRSAVPVQPFPEERIAAALGRLQRPRWRKMLSLAAAGLFMVLVAAASLWKWDGVDWDDLQMHSAVSVLQLPEYHDENRIMAIGRIRFLLDRMLDAMVAQDQLPSFFIAGLLEALDAENPPVDRMAVPFEVLMGQLQGGPLTNEGLRDLLVSSRAGIAAVRRWRADEGEQPIVALFRQKLRRHIQIAQQSVQPR